MLLRNSCPRGSGQYGTWSLITLNNTFFFAVGNHTIAWVLWALCAPLTLTEKKKLEPDQRGTILILCIKVLNSPRIRWVGPSADTTFDFTAELISSNNSDVANKWVGCNMILLYILRLLIISIRIVVSRQYNYTQLEDLWQRNALAAIVYSSGSPGMLTA